MLNRISSIAQYIGNEGSSIILTIVISFLRGILNHDNFGTVIIDSALCGVFSLAVLHTEYFTKVYAANHDSAILLCMVIGGVGSKYLLKVITNIFDTFVGKNLNK